ncbi:MAG TPA: endonuclease/exonuclease/phosphatase family protein [Pirellulales bacterium]|jgi:endonuclease/exonuclease/phosphatase family metal-dependent hydrolase
MSRHRPPALGLLIRDTPIFFDRHPTKLLMMKHRMANHRGTGCRRSVAVTILICTFTNLAGAQSTLRVVTYNIGADINGITTPQFGTSDVLEAIGAENHLGIQRPLDILALQETTSNDLTVAPLITDLNSFYSGSAIYAASPVQGLQNGSNAFGNGPNAMVYNTKTLQLIDSVGVGVPLGSLNGEYRQVMRYEFQPIGGAAANSFYVYVTHMKSSFSGDPFVNETYRDEEAQIIRADAATVATPQMPDPSILYVGDFNLDGSATTSNGVGSISAYQTMTAPGPGHAVDPLNANPQNNNLIWANNPAFAPILTESATNLQYRDDLQLMTQNVLVGASDAALKYVPGSLHSFGNDGSVGLGGSVTDPANTALNDLDPNFGFDPLLISLELTIASDHLPVVADYTFVVPEPPTDFLSLLAIAALLSRHSFRPPKS